VPKLFFDKTNNSISYRDYIQQTKLTSMNIKNRLIAMNFLQFFVWGIWLISLGGYMFTLPGDMSVRGSLVGATYGTMGWASLFMPALMGIIADKYLRAEIVLGLCHFMAGLCLYYAGTLTNANDLYYAIFFTSCFYMPTIALSNSVSYTLLSKNNFDVQKSFAPIRVWGTVGFIVAEWLVDLLGWTGNSNQFNFAAAAEVAIAAFCFTLPACDINKSTEKKSFSQILGLDAFVLFRDKKMAIFFLFAMLIGAALQITNMFGTSFLLDFGAVEMYKNSFAVKHSNIMISLSQISETLFILTIPFVLKRYGIKKVMLISLVAWVLRFALFGIGNPGTGFVFLVMSMIVYGMAFDFFNISGSLYVEKQTDSKIRSSAQGLFMLMTNGLGAILGGVFAGKVVDYFTTTVNNVSVKNWPNIWYSFAGYALVILVLFVFLFKYKHDENEVVEVKH
jgi:MFS transporter, NHS family, xanthosine permease